MEGMIGDALFSPIIRACFLILELVMRIKFTLTVETGEGSGQSSLCLHVAWYSVSSHHKCQPTHRRAEHSEMFFRRDCARDIGVVGPRIFFEPIDASCLR